MITPVEAVRRSTVASPRRGEVFRANLFPRRLTAIGGVQTRVCGTLLEHRGAENPETPLLSTERQGLPSVGSLASLRGLCEQAGAREEFLIAASRGKNSVEGSRDVPRTPIHRDASW
jgi:hypothetical protein